MTTIFRILTAGLLICFLPSSTIEAQGFAFGIKSGLTVGFQKWDNGSFESRDPLFRYHGIAFIESLAEENKFAVFAQAGYHIKGSAVRTLSFTNINGIRIPGRSTNFQFRNVSVTVGGKQKFDLGATAKYYYLVGLRGDYTVSTQLRPEWLDETFVTAYYPFEAYVNNWNYGATIGGGLEFPFGELIGGMIEFTVNPDFSKQYNAPRIDNVVNTNPNSTNTITIPERQIANTTFEISLGLKFLRKVEYID